jgi:aminoglycoside phosphotransferase (APT) family kinase protein
MGQDAFLLRLQSAIARHLGPEYRIDNAVRLTGGAASTTWRFDVLGNSLQQTLVLRLSQGNSQISTGIDKQTEAEVLKVAVGAGVPAPTIAFILDAADELGDGFAMEFISGESIPRKILRDEQFEDVRGDMAQQCGRILASIHKSDASGISQLPVLDAATQLEEYESLYRGYGERIPVFEFALRWLERKLPERPAHDLVHGDFRNGNILVTAEDGIKAVLDWELSHIGDGMEDLGWLCVNSWRFGNRDKPVGGFGQRRELFDAYEQASGRTVDEELVRYWEIFGTLRWGIMCLYLSFEHLDGSERSVERAAIGRRVSETEIDLLQLL